ncbi:polysaccharide biosynthesis tyrosine autokinase [Flavobacterium sp. NG2]|uniref:GumC family protein n=1 Tax=Flavobacterium sp. NG2 TaxID=3097547 RepID=UPI002A804015|nr:polysaccharide biosynthesis tyrosine autokinase [Flavobacterium sp. NG2]WPR71626.1 polysaccharide biosynthesis tyrosine autokinase [Flavobacterium sp. NG2]
MQNNLLNEETENDFQLRVIIDQYASHWKWFLLSVFICLSLAFVYLKLATPQYQSNTTILVKEDKNSMLSELSAFSDMGFGGGIKNDIDNEIEILRSRTLVESTVNELDLNVSLFAKKKFVTRELYSKAPILVRFENRKPKYYESEAELVFLKTGNNSFSLIEKVVEDRPLILVNSKKEYHFGETIPTSCGDLVIDKSVEHFSTNNLWDGESEIFIRLNPIADVAEGFRSQLKVNPVSKQSSVLELSLVDGVVEKSEQFLDNLVRIYNNNAVEDKNLISGNTSKFIAKRLALIAEELDGVEQDGESFKTSNRLTDIESEAKLFIEGSSEYDKKGIETEIQLNVANSMLDFIKKSNNSDLLPSNMISKDESSSTMVDSYNELVLERNRLLKSATAENPTVIKLDQQIASLRANVISSLERLRSSLTIQKRNLNNQEGLIDNRIKKIPSQERQFRAIARQQKVKEELYLYLLQKREETAIALSATEPNARVIDAAKAQKQPVFPKRAMITLVALILGLLIPFSILYLIDLLDTKVKTRLDIEGKTLIPFIGDLPTSESDHEVMNTGSRSSSAEALRIIRTNLEFMISKASDDKAKTIFLTSTFPKEGKTFVSVNLAATFALSGKKVLLIGMDIRNPRIDDYLTLPERGVTNFLSDKNIDLNSLVVKQEGYDNFYVLPSGVIPPNPAELLMSSRVDTIFETLKAQYDYIIVDTAPVSLVTDTLLIAKHADCFVYVVRANVLEKRMLNIPSTLYRDNKLPNMCMLLNDTDSSKGYGYSYGYGVHAQNEPWYKKLKK